MFYFKFMNENTFTNTCSTASPTACALEVQGMQAKWPFYQMDVFQLPCDLGYSTDNLLSSPGLSIEACVAPAHWRH